MSKKTPHLRTLELRRLMTQHELTTRQVGELLGRSRQAVKRWTSELTLISVPMLDLLKYKLQERPTKPH